MKSNQLNLGQANRLMYIENKEDLIDGADARIGWVSFSKMGKIFIIRVSEYEEILMILQQVRSIGYRVLRKVVPMRILVSLLIQL